MRSSLKLALVVLLLSVAWADQAEAAPVQKSGYITMADGVTLRYTVALPDASGRFPVAMKYDGYCEGTAPITCNEGHDAAALLAGGYAVLGVNLRGTGCSGGEFDFRDPVENTDGAAAVEWAARQPWSTGHVGMFGDSFPGLTQPGIAALHPHGLDAIAPWQIVDDPYRDVAYPGGLANGEFGASWGFGDQPPAAGSSAAAGLQAGDAQCAQNLAQQAANPTTNIFVTAFQHPYIDTMWRSKTVGPAAGRITVPAFACASWQDDETGSLSTWTLWPRLNPARTWVVATNGYHSMCVYPASITNQLVRFFDRYVKGAQNHFEETTPHMQIWHETSGVGDDAKPAWVTSSSSWPPATDTSRLYLRSGSALSAAPPASAEPADTYASPTVSAGTENGLIAGQSSKLWKVPGTAGGARAYTTPALGRDVELLGPASVDLWLSSTATDTDLQATITEVRPDGQETYVARGWLQASQRKLDRQASTSTLPVHTHLASDVQPLVAGAPTQVRLGVYPFDHVFRAGSRIRVILDTPSQTGGWNFKPGAGAGVDSILHDAQHHSEIVVGTVPGASPKAHHRPVCDTLLNQPCRPDAFTESDPPGTLHWPRSIVCKRRTSVRVHLRRAPRHDKLVSAVLAINGRTVKRLRGRKLTRVVELRKLPTTAFRLTVTLRTKRGKTLRSTRRYGACS